VSGDQGLTNYSTVIWSLIKDILKHHPIHYGVHAKKLLISRRGEKCGQPIGRRLVIFGI
jgi:hypothetical protein